MDKAIASGNEIIRTILVAPVLFVPRVGCDKPRSPTVPDHKGRHNLARPGKDREQGDLSGPAAGRALPSVAGGTHFAGQRVITLTVTSLTVCKDGWPETERGPNSGRRRTGPHTSRNPDAVQRGSPKPSHNERRVWETNNAPGHKVVPNQAAIQRQSGLKSD
jgi:hypothetical protein